MEEVKISLSGNAAKAYHNAAEADKRKLERIVNEMVEYVLDKDNKDAFFLARKSLSDEALANGLTPKMLETILNEEEK